MRESVRSERFDLFTPGGELLGEFRLYTEVNWMGAVEHWARIDIYGGPLLVIYKDVFPLFLDVLAGRRRLEELKNLEELWLWCTPNCNADFVEVWSGPQGAVLKIYAEMWGEVGTIRRLYEAVLPSNAIRRVERRVRFIHCHPR